MSEKIVANSVGYSRLPPAVVHFPPDPTCALGCDPGMSGSLVIVTPDGSIVDFCLADKTFIGKTARLNSLRYAEFIEKHSALIKHGFIEKVGAMPGQGVSGMFNFGYSAGVLEGVLVAKGIPVQFIPPPTWKKSQGLSGLDKDAARHKASLLNPGIRELALKGKGQAIADAYFIARHGQRFLS